jgi:hypothetical protein
MWLVHFLYHCYRFERFLDVDFQAYMHCFFFRIRYLILPEEVSLDRIYSHPSTASSRLTLLL